MFVHFFHDYCAGPMFLSPCSEWFGRKPVMMFSVCCFFIFQLGCALAQNIETIPQQESFSSFSSFGSVIAADLVFR
jgi:MFS family permease